MNEQIRIDENTVFNPETGEFGTLPEILIFSSDKSILTDDLPAVVNWTVSNALIVKLNDELIEPTGSREFYTSELLLLTLTASNSVGEATSRTISIDINREPPVINFFRAGEAFVISGYPVTLNWDVTGASRLFIDNYVGDVTGLTVKTVTLGSIGVFNLTATSHFGIKTEAHATVAIFPVPLITGIFIPVPNFNLEAISEERPTFNMQARIWQHIEYNQPDFTQMDRIVNNVLFNKRGVKAILFPYAVFRLLTSKQKEITYIVKSIWKKQIRERMKRRLDLRSRD